MARAPIETRSGRDVRTRADIADLCAAYKFRGEGLVIAIAVCQAESGFDVLAINPGGPHPPYGPATGLFQVLPLLDPSSATNSLDRRRVFGDLLKPGLNVQFAYDLSRGGSNWKPWTTYTNGKYRDFLAAAREEALGTRSPLLTDSARRAPRTVSAVGNDWIDEDQAPLPVVVGGGAAAGDLGNSVVSATLDLSMAEASELQLEIEDENVDLLQRQFIDEGSPLDVLDLRHLVTTVGLTQGPGSPHWLVTSQPAGVVRLRGVTPSAQTATTAVDYVRNLAQSAGLAFLGGPMSPTVDVNPAQVSLGGSQTIQELDPATGLLGGSRTENAWEVARRLAAETTGYVCFEAAGTLHFATQGWLYEHTGVLYVQVENAVFKDQRVPSAIRPIGYPKLTRTLKRDANNGVYPHVTAEIELPPGPGYAARPGMRLWLAEPSGLVENARPMLIQRVSIAVGDQTKTVRVTAASYTAPGDVEAQPATVAGDAPGIGPAVRGTRTSQNGWPASPDPSSINIKSFPIGGTGLKLRMAAGAGPILTYVAEQFAATVEPLDSGQCGGYAFRNIRGSSSTISNHGSGTAIDLNSLKHPLGARGTFSPDQVRAIRRILASCNGTVRWGGDYRSRKDEMHFEIIADPVVARSRGTSVPRGAAPIGP